MKHNDNNILSRLKEFSSIVHSNFHVSMDDFECRMYVEDFLQKMVLCVSNATSPRRVIYSVE